MSGRLPAGQLAVGPRRGRIKLDEARCTACDACVRDCPDACIQLTSHLETRPAPTPHGRPRRHAVLDEFTIDFGRCMYCGICIEVCPFDALAWEGGTLPPGSDRAELTADRTELTADRTELTAGGGPVVPLPGA